MPQYDLTANFAAGICGGVNVGVSVSGYDIGQPTRVRGKVLDTRQGARGSGSAIQGEEHSGRLGDIGWSMDVGVLCLRGQAGIANRIRQHTSAEVQSPAARAR